MSAERNIEINKPTEGTNNIQVQKIESETFSSAEVLEKAHLEKVIKAERNRNWAVGGGLILGVEGAKMLLYGNARNDIALSTAGGIVLTASSSLALYGLTVLKESYKAAKKEFSEIQARLASINK
jgi:hypothetical protein